MKLFVSRKSLGSRARRGMGLLAFTACVCLARAASTPPATVPAPPTPAEDEDEFGEYGDYAVTQVADPFERFNRTIYKFNGTTYHFVFQPVSRVYTTVVPTKARKGLGSFFENLAFPLRFVSSLLQGKIDRSAAETAKFLLNSTIGLGGFIKVSDNVPELRVPDEDLGQTFGAWGIKQGPYIVIPILGPSSVRDAVGRIGAYPLNPLRWEFADSLDWRVRDGLPVLEIVNGMPETLENLDRVTRSAVDPYVAVRNGYMQYREAEVKK